MRKDKQQPEIIILGLGPGNPDLLTVRAAEVLSTAERIYLRTEQHPTVAGLQKSLNTHSFDWIYEDESDYKKVDVDVDEYAELEDEEEGQDEEVYESPEVDDEEMAQAIDDEELDEEMDDEIDEGNSFGDTVPQEDDDQEFDSDENNREEIVTIVEEMLPKDTEAPSTDLAEGYFMQGGGCSLILKP